MKHKIITSIVLLLCATAPALSASDAPTGKPNKVEEVIVIIKTHFDIGYTHRVKDIVHHYRTAMIDRAMDIMDQSNNIPPEQRFA